MTTSPDEWVYGDFAPDPASRDLPGLKASWLLDQLPAVGSPSILDYGAGEGKHLHLIRRVMPRSRLVGVDTRAVHSAVDFEFHQVGSRDPLPFPASQFDIVVSFDVLEHVESVAAALAEIHRVLRPGGSFIGFVPAEGGYGPHGFFRLLDRNVYRDSKDHVQAFTRRQLLEWFGERFRVSEVAYSYHFFGALMDAVFFASFKAPVIGPRVEAFWRGQENHFYRGRRTGDKGITWPRLLIRLANLAAYYESKLLKRLPLGAAGLHFHLLKP